EKEGYPSDDEEKWEELDEEPQEEGIEKKEETKHEEKLKEVEKQKEEEQEEPSEEGIKRHEVQPGVVILGDVEIERSNNSLDYTDTSNGKNVVIKMGEMTYRGSKFKGFRATNNGHPFCIDCEDGEIFLPGQTKPIKATGIRMEYDKATERRFIKREDGGLPTLIDPRTKIEFTGLQTVVFDNEWNFSTAWFSADSTSKSISNLDVPEIIRSYATAKNLEVSWWFEKNNILYTRYNVKSVMLNGTKIPVESITLNVETDKMVNYFVLASTKWERLDLGGGIVYTGLSNTVYNRAGEIVRVTPQKDEQSKITIKDDATETDQNRIVFNGQIYDINNINETKEMRIDLLKGNIKIRAAGKEYEAEIDGMTLDSTGKPLEAVRFTDTDTKKRMIYKKDGTVTEDE
ncbi:MAG: hypothetical protein LBF56_03665, partial [Holosporales bacterium]|nr:hypothetical protein [Holosporales bacterium]